MIHGYGGAGFTGGFRGVTPSKKTFVAEYSILITAIIHLLCTYKCVLFPG